MDVLILSEHWQWPFELHQLQDLHPDFSAHSVADKRLNVDSDLSRGCGGVTILSRKSLKPAVVDIGTSDCICAIRLQSSSRVVSIIGVYLPSSGSSVVSAI